MIEVKFKFYIIKDDEKIYVEKTDDLIRKAEDKILQGFKEGVVDIIQSKMNCKNLIFEFVNVYFELNNKNEKM
jgi:hypothetical protein